MALINPLRPGERETLEWWLRSRTTPQRRFERARIVLGSAHGKFGYVIAHELG